MNYVCRAHGAGGVYICNLRARRVRVIDNFIDESQATAEGGLRC